MRQYKSKPSITLLLDVLAIAISFCIALFVRYNKLIEATGSRVVVPMYIKFFIGALVLYVALFFVFERTRIERMSKRELFWITFRQQSVFVVTYVIFFFLFHEIHNMSRILIGIFYLLNLFLCSFVRMIYWQYCRMQSGKLDQREVKQSDEENSLTDIRHCYIIGAKSIGQYGGYESFVLNLLQQHKNNSNIKYHVACKANGHGYMDLEQLTGVERINEREFSYCNAHGHMITVPEKLGSAQAIYYDIKAMQWACSHIEKNHIENPIVYILASRIGPFERKYVRRIHQFGGKVLQNPDGHEDWRRKWSLPIRRYWKLSERYAVKYADLVVCDSKNIEAYIRDEYSQYHPNTTYIAYGSYVEPSPLTDDNPKYKNWLTEHNLKDGEYYISVGRFVPENNFDIMIREFMRSKTKKAFAIITTENGKYAEELQQKLQYKKDKRIKFVGTVYDPELLSKIRTNAYGYFHGHEVGGTNPSLLESLGTTNLNLLYDVGFNKEVAEDAALYWSKEEGDLARLIDKVDHMSEKDIQRMGEMAKERIRQAYSWEYICDRYAEVFLQTVL